MSHCTLCHDLGWVLDTRLRELPLMVEMIPCPIPDCEMSGRAIQSVCFKDVEFTEISRRSNGVVMKVGRPL